MILVHIKAVIAWCRKNMYEVCSADSVTISSEAGRKKTKKSLQPSDIAKLFSSSQTSMYRKAVQDPLIHAYRFCVITGLRRGQLVGLQWSDIEGNKLTISRAINRLKIQTDGKNENAIRDMVLPTKAIEQLNAQKAEQRKAGIVTPWVFSDDKGNMLDPTNLYQSWKKYLKHNDLPELSFHEIRHTAITMYKGNVPKELLKDVVGHSASMDTFGVYSHAFDGKLEQTAAAMDSVLSAIIK